MARQLLEQQKEAEEAKREAELKMKKDEEEKAAKEEATKLAMDKKLAKEAKEKRRRWETKKLLAEQAEEFEMKLEKIIGINRKLKGLTIGAKKKGKASATPSGGSEEGDVDEEEEEEATPLKDERKRRDSTGAVENSPPVETPKKQGKKEREETPASQKRKTRGRPTKAESQAAHVAKGEDPWEGVLMGEKYAIEAAYRKAVRKTISSFYPETLQAMCKGAGLPFYDVNDAVDTLSKLRVAYCYRGKKPSSSTSSKPGEEDQIRGEVQEPQGEDVDE
ncbi:hypothetical protein CBR_g27850 [Chara braunii]|uniref:Uncharacterized protein n=1 Tax=Chara braunii TaxID=69332 RepID=A0A388L8L7_CHABU|nr:hypothetical protein CBR_g27850 [Chara braunii]|eukprot:GBG78624.1 hypothetical protein CBR_g27850 [Chara braunii]